MSDERQLNRVDLELHEEYVIKITDDQAQKIASILNGRAPVKSFPDGYKGFLITERELPDVEQILGRATFYKEPVDKGYFLFQ